MIMFPLVKPPDPHILEWFGQRWQADKTIKTTEPDVRDKPQRFGRMRELFPVVLEPGDGKKR